MKRHIQTTGIRQWAGEDLLELQAEPLKAIDNFFAEYGSCILRGCSLTDNGDGTFRIAPGLVALEGKDVDQQPAFMVVPFAGTESTTLPTYLTLDHTIIRRTYVDDRLKPIACDYQAVLSSVKPEDGIFLELSEDHFPRFTDVIQDPEHRFFTDAEREMLNQHDADIERIDLKDAEQDDRLDDHDAEIRRIDLKDTEQDNRLDNHDQDIQRIDTKDAEQDNRLNDHDKEIKRIDLKDAEQDNRLDDHDEEVKRINLKDEEQDDRLANHDEEIKRIDTKDEEQDGRLNDHDAAIGQINKDDAYQDSRLDDHDEAIQKINRKDEEQDGRLENHNQLFAEHTKGENKNSLSLYKVSVDTTGHIQDVEEVIKKDIVDLGIPAQDTTYSVATQTTNGLMAATDKTKLDGVATGANNYTHPTHTAKSNGLYKVTVDAAGHVSATESVTKADITELGVPGENTIYGVATQTTNGLMSSTDKTKLDGVATGANNYTHPAYTAHTAGFNKLTVDSTGHVSGITAVDKTDITALGIPAQDTTYSIATASANGLMSSIDKNRLDGLVSNAVQGATIDGTEVPKENNILKFPGMGQELVTFTVDSNQKLAAWANNQSGNDYSIVLVKQGIWTGTKEIDLTATQTKRIYGEPGSKIEITGAEYALGYNLSFSDSRGVDSNEYLINGLTVEGKNLTGGRGVISGCCNLYNCKAITDGNGSNAASFFTCLKLYSCYATSNIDTIGVGFLNCKYLTGCHGAELDTSFFNCDFLNNCRGNANLKVAYSNCNHLTCCSGDVNYDHAYVSCSYLSNCHGEQGSEGNFYNCYYLTGCGDTDYKECYYLYGCYGTFTNCSNMLGNRASRTNGYTNCTVTAGGTAVSATAAGGFNT